MSESILDKGISHIDFNFKYAPHIFLLGIVFYLNQISNIRESRLKSDTITPEFKYNVRKLKFLYTFMINLAKAVEWAINPFLMEMLNSKIQGRAGIKLLPIPYAISCIAGPILFGYLIDKSNKVALVFYPFLMIFSLFFKFVNNPLVQVFSQVLFGCSMSILHYGFENWLNSKAKILFPNEIVREIALSGVYETAIIYEGISAVIVFLISNYLKVFFFHKE